MQKIIGLIIFTSILVPLIAIQDNFNEDPIIDLLKKKNSKWEDIEYYLDKGSFNGIFTYNQMLKIYFRISQEFPHYVLRGKPIGQTFLGQNIYSFGLTANKNLLQDKNHSAIFINSLHHSREAITLNMNIYLNIKFLHDLLNEDSETTELLSNTVVYTVPVVNVDSFKIICQKYDGSKHPLFIRKNRNNDSQSCQNGEQIGVDLNRNYPYQFGIDQVGSSSDPCSEIYRGKFAFSQPQTRAIRDFVNSQPGIKLALNFHSQGNLWVFPYNYAQENMLKEQNPAAYSVFQQFKNNADFDTSAKIGNAFDTLGYFQDNVPYLANGQASDWMLFEKNIIAFSPEMGDGTYESHTFFPQKQQILPIINNMHRPMIYLLSLMKFTPKLKLFQRYDPFNKQQFISNYLGSNDQQIEDKLNIIQMKIFHEGLLDTKELDLSLKFFIHENSLSQENQFLQNQPQMIRNLYLIDSDESEELFEAAQNPNLIDLINELEIAYDENQIVYKLKLDEFRGRSSQELIIVLHNENENNQELHLQAEFQYGIYSKSLNAINLNNLQELQITNNPQLWYQYKNVWIINFLIALCGMLLIMLGIYQICLVSILNNSQIDKEILQSSQIGNEGSIEASVIDFGDQQQLVIE